MKKIYFVIAVLVTFFLAPTISQAQADKISQLNWVSAPAVGKVGDKAEFKVTGSSMFLDPFETDKFLQLNGNLPTKDAYTIASSKGDWFGILKVVEEGYVKDDEKIDADALLESLKEGNKIGNEKKKEKGGAGNSGGPTSGSKVGGGQAAGGAPKRFQRKSGGA